MTELAAELRRVRPGDFFVGQIGNPLTAFWVGIGQAIIGDGSRYNHAGIILNRGELIEAMPGGARIVPITELYGRPGPTAFSRWNLTDAQRAAIVAVARPLEGRPYSFLDYLSLALLHLKIRPDWITDRVAGSGHMLCSQLVDHVLSECGHRVFVDGRLPGDVTPGDLAYVLDGPEQEASLPPYADL